MPVQGDLGNAEFFQLDWFERGYPQVRWVDYGEIRRGKRLPELVRQPSTDSAFWVGPRSNVAVGAARLANALNRAQNDAVGRISSWDPLAGICDLPGACADDWLTGNYTVLLPLRDPVLRSGPVEQQVVQTQRSAFPLPGSTASWWIVLDSSDQPDRAYTLSKSLAKKSRLTADLGVFLIGQKWRIGLFGMGDAATGDALFGILQEDFSGAQFYADARRFQGVLELSQWTENTNAVCNEVIAWRRSHPDLWVRVVLHGPKDRASFSGNAFVAFANRLNTELRDLGLSPVEMVLEWNDPHASECSSGCNHLNPPHDRLVIFAAKP